MTPASVIDSDSFGNNTTDIQKHMIQVVRAEVSFCLFSNGNAVLINSVICLCGGPLRDFPL